MIRLKRSFSLIMAVALLCGNLTCNGMEVLAMTRNQVNVKISSLEKDIKALKQQKKVYEAKEKQESAGARYLMANVVSRTPFIVQDAASSYYWVTDGRYFDDYFAMVMGYVKLTGNYRTYNGNITCAECYTIKVGSKSNSIQTKINKKNRELKKCKNSLKEQVKLEDEEIKIGKSTKITKSWKYGNTYNKLTWTSSDLEIATVDEKGRVTGHGAGTAVITAKTDISKKTSKCKVTVLGKKPGKIRFSSSNQNIAYNGREETENIYLYAKWPYGEEGETIYLSSSDEKVAVIEEKSRETSSAYDDGEEYEYEVGIRIIGPGTTVITAKTESGLSVQCNIQISDERINDEYDE